MAIEAVSDIKRAGVSAFAAGGGNSYSASVNVAIATQYQADVTVTNASASVASKVFCQLLPNADWDADDLAEFEVFGTPSIGQVMFTITRQGPIVGDFLVFYSLG